MKGTPIFEEVFIVMLRQRAMGIKLLIGCLLGFIPIVNLLAFGYLFRFSRRVRRSGELTAPEWTDWRGLFLDGLRFAVIWLCYWFLPLSLISLLSCLLYNFGIGVIAYILFSVSCVCVSVLFASALYRYQMREDFKDLMDVNLIVKMAYLEFPRFLVPALVCFGLFALLLPLYGLAWFVPFFVLIGYTGLCFRRLEYQDSVSF